MGRFCKTCRYLGNHEIKGEHVFRCEWLMHNALPWAFLMKPTPTSLLVGKRYVSPEWCAQNPLHAANIAAGIGSDWTEVMDCPVWVSAQ
jgi:hypothetical protein